MAYTYNTATNIGKVRLLIGDTDASDVLLQDEEINVFITTYGKLQLAASHAAMAISAKFTREADKRVGNLSITYSNRANNYKTLSKELKNSAASTLFGYIGGISKSDKTVNEDNVDRVSPSFRRNMMRLVEGDDNG